MKKLLLFILLLRLSNLNQLVAQTEVSGIISSNTTWAVAGNPYVVVGNVLAKTGVTLTIEPGVVVKFDSAKCLQVDGELIARGTSSDQITFTSNKPIPSAGDWGYIFLSDSSVDVSFDESGNYIDGSILEYCIVEYAGGVSVSNNGAVRMDNAHPFVNYCEVRNNKTSGICGSNLSGTLKITNNAISYNTENGIYAFGDTVIISNNTVSNNAGDGVWAVGTVKISNNTIRNNTGNGIDTYFYSYGNTTIYTIFNNTISNNTGRGIDISIPYYSSTTFTISNNTISDNTKGGIYNDVYSTSATIYHNIINNNGTSAYLGGIYIFGMQNLEATISNNIINNNTTSYSGGGIGIWRAAYTTVTISNNTVVNNTAYSNGGGIWAPGSDMYSVVNISNNIISNNTAYGSGGGIHGGGVVTKNSVIGNFADQAAAVYYPSGNNYNFKYNTITGNKATGVTPTYNVYIGSNPLFNYNNIFNNSATYELYNSNAQGSANVDAKNNWWGTTVDAEIQAKIWDWFDDGTKGIVNYSPYLTALDTAAPISPPMDVTKSAAGGGVQLTWSPNVESDIAGYKVYYGSPTGYSFANVVDVGNVTSYKLTGVSILDSIAVTAYDIHADGVDDQVEGHESWFAYPPDTPVESIKVITNQGWNMLSLPVLVPDSRTTELFPTAISLSFTYEGNYTPKDTLTTGIGYWLKFPTDTVITFTGQPIDRETVEVRQGWNMIGSISSSVGVGTIGSLPEGIFTSYFFAYDGSAYVVVDTIEPGHAYWVRVSSDGGLILSQSGSASSSTRIRIVADGELPPPPPEGERISARNFPTEFGLEQNYPNPFNPSTIFRYRLPVASKVRLTISNLLGKVVAVLVDGVQDAGFKSVEWDGVNVASGVYFYRLEATNINDPSRSFIQVKKSLLIK